MFFQVSHGVHGGLDGAALVVGVIGIQKLPFTADQGNFCSGGAGVYAEKAVAGIRLKLRLGYHRFRVAGEKAVVFLLRGEQRLHPVQLEAHLNAAVEPVDQGGEGDAFASSPPSSMATSV